MPRAMPQRALAVRATVAGDDVADVGDDVGFGQVAAPVDAGDVEAGFVGADDEIGHRRDAAVGDTRIGLRAARAGRGNRVRCPGARGSRLRWPGGSRPGPASFASLISLTAWSPRTSASTKPCLAVITATDFDRALRAGCRATRRRPRRSSASACRPCASPRPRPARGAGSAALRPVSTLAA